MGGVFVVKYGYHKEVKMKRLLIAMVVSCAAIALSAPAALARTVSLDSIDGTAATVTVGPGEANETLRLAYGKVDGGTDMSAWGTISASLADVPAEGGTFNVVLPLAPLESLDSLVWRIVTAPPHIATLAAIYGNGQTYFDTGITNASTDSVELAIRVSSYGSGYSGIFGARADASEQNISTFCSKDCDVYVDFNSSDAITYRAVPTFPGGSDYAALDMTIAISAAERHVDAFRNGVAVSSTRNSSTNRTVCANEFVCAGSAYIFRINGQPQSGWGYTAGSGYGFVSCRIDRGGAMVADMVPVLLSAGEGAIYDQVRKCYLTKLGTISALGTGAITSFSAITGATDAYRRAASREITVSKASDNKLKVKVNAGETSGSLVMAYGASDAGGHRGNWNANSVIAQFGNAALSVEVDFPAGWGETVTALRFFAVSLESYLESSGTQYIDTCWTNGSNHVVEMNFQPLALPNNGRALYGCRKGASDKNIVMFVDGSDFICDFNSSDYGRYRVKAGRSASHRYRMVDSAARRIVERSQAGVVVSAFTNAIPCTDTFTCAGSAYLFAGNDMSSGSPAVLWSANGLPSIRFYSLRVWTTDGTLVSEILPVEDGGVAKVYDTVRGIYLENAGSGDFTYGEIESAPPFCVGDLITPQTKSYTGFMVIVH